MGNKKDKDRHHRKCRSRNGGDEPTNISIVKRNYHQAYHLLFNNMLPNEMAKMLTDTWIDPDFYMVAIPRKKSRRKVMRKKGKKFLKIIIEI